MADGSTIFDAVTDGLGNVIALTTSSGVQRTYQYEAWSGAEGGVDTWGFSGKDRVRFKGAMYLPEVGLYSMRNRWYEPFTGRFLMEDPFGISGGTNPYLFAGNDPINGFDPLGLQPAACYRLPFAFPCRIRGLTVFGRRDPTLGVVAMRSNRNEDQSVRRETAFYDPESSPEPGESHDTRQPADREAVSPCDPTGAAAKGRVQALGLGGSAIGGGGFPSGKRNLEQREVGWIVPNGWGRHRLWCGRILFVGNLQRRFSVRGTIHRGMCRRVLPCRMSHDECGWCHLVRSPWSRNPIRRICCAPGDRNNRGDSLFAGDEVGKKVPWGKA